MSLRSLAATAAAVLGLMSLSGSRGPWIAGAWAQTPPAAPANPAPAPLPPIPGCPQLVASGNPQYPPYLWRDPVDEQKLIGANADLMQWVAAEIGIPIETRYIGPWGRVQEEARAGRVDLVAGAFFTLPRTEYMDYFHPAFRETRSVVWTRAGAPVPYKRWSDLGPLQGVTVINNSFGVEFDTYARQSLKITQVASIEQAIQMLQRGRADYMIYEDTPAEAYAARNGGPAIRPLTPAVAHEGLYLTLSHRSRCNTPELRGRLARAVYKLTQDRVMARFVDQGFINWRKQAAL
ncbi:transporter substrate-binding domain-containing protein [Roseateles sp.]|uniref:substrate-binding periplasmic protein n=1 Tax=Roseateles sp. TaxID=1971397 RepID=UPI0031DE0C7E